MIGLCYNLHTVETLDYTITLAQGYSSVVCPAPGLRLGGTRIKRAREVEERAKSRAEFTTSSLENETALASTLVPHA